ncbi:membrane protein [Candidatus Mancarchaeum acidiphilum]|uniref:Membrane protein n=1 Tax=Candidatus Mancarchaeum acidiphilum TaxID=1920749 RepID=A0A218NP90_9ARCH|nr:lysylphosphatidylglycerol synthase transmembrane domain-containing protein [Candidatus Mancarchaeum acidiphilum]ASI14297.1 membrane protein [Candidatus Mancarchaeum acidiphilum]
MEDSESKNKKDKKSIWYTILHIQNLNEDDYLHLVKRLMYFVGAGFVASFLIFFVIAYIGGIGRVSNIILSSNVGLYILAFAAVLSGYLIRFIKWDYYLKVVGIEVPKKKSMAIYLSLYSMDLTPGKLGRVLAAYTINRVTKKRVTKIVPIVTMDIFTDFIGVGILAIFTALYFNKFVVEVLAIDILLLLPYLFILNSRFYRFIKRIVKNERFLKFFNIYGDEYFASQSILNTPKTYILSVLVSVPAAFLNALALYFSLLAIHLKVSIPVIETVFIATSSALFGMITGIPGNLGVTDGSLVALISALFSLNLNISSAVTIMFRFATLWFGVIIGGIFLVYTFRYWTNKDVIKEGLTESINNAKNHIEKKFDR